MTALAAYFLLPSDQPAPGGGLGLTPGGWWIAETFLYWIVWTVGAAIAEAYVGRVRVGAPWYFAFIAVVALTRWVTPAASATWVGGWMLNDLEWSAMFAIVLSIWLIARPVRLPPPVMHVSARAGDISYSLYLVHVPVIAFVSACWFAAGEPIPVGLELALPTAVLASCVAVLIWYVAERPFQRSRLGTFTIGARPGSTVAALSTKGSSPA
jgi:peptidoglycan/LPS O-acetylase OafA/YrhL